MIFFLYLSSFSFAAQYNFNSNCKNAYYSIINLDFNTAKNQIDYEKRLNPDNLICVYLENYIDFLSIVITEDRALFNNFKNNKNGRISLLEKGNKNSPYYNYCLAEVYLQWAAARIIFKEYVTAAYEINKAYRLLNKNQSAFPSFVPNLKSLGLFNALTGSIPDDYQWVLSIIGYDGTIERGINQLGIVLRSAQNSEEFDFLLLETTFFMAYVNLNLYNDEDKLDLLVRFIENEHTIQSFSQTSAIINYALANIYIRSKLNNDKAIQILNAFQPCESCFQFPLRNLLLANAKLNKLDDDADKYFKVFLGTHRGQNYIKEAYLKLAWHSFLHNDTLAYFSYLDKIKLRGATDTDDDKMALTEAESGILPNYFLLKSRLLFDGGYYNRSLETLMTEEAQNSFETTKEALEFVYRSARIYHEMNTMDKAISFYELTIEKGADYTYYFAANASLQLGLIYEQKQNFQEAEKYFVLAQHMNNTEYKNSINQKAKAGINRLKK
ncbi:MAG: hypothetical protein PHT69_08285 [Bacteroidales bacterium]|nr:hypothetical protein [Bacteroidales bacterium]